MQFKIIIDDASGSWDLTIKQNIPNSWRNGGDTQRRRNKLCHELIGAVGSRRDRWRGGGNHGLTQRPVKAAHDRIIQEKVVPAAVLADEGVDVALGTEVVSIYRFNGMRRRVKGDLAVNI